ncbi:hypothetical protein [Streptococcus porcinus]|nr:hypothetical protein [Streptococcus porcinus]SQG43309.1 putative lipoprotein [Streptococcus porcinus]VTT42481.1 putative lipoprotein [Streptococcus porcinus]VTT43941.1 putative lipoprotein [Streptococcus porcinus]
MTKKFVVSVLVVLLACSSILYLGQYKEAGKEHFPNRVTSLKQKKAVANKNTSNLSKLSKKTGDKKMKTVEFLNNKTDLDKGQSQEAQNQQAMLPPRDKTSPSSEIPVTGVTKEVNQPNVLDDKENSAQVSKASQSSEEMTPTLDRSALAPMPVSSIGTWAIQLKSDFFVTITISEDGTVTRVDQSLKSSSDVQSKTVHFKGVYDRGNGNYQLVGNYGADQAIMILGGIGGYNIKYVFGMHVEGNSLTPILWQTGIDSEFDYNVPLTGPTLIKQ